MEDATMANRLEGKVAIVTGAGRGIGRAEALALAAEGCAVVVNDLGGAPDGTGASTSPADEVVEEIRKMGARAAANYDRVASMEAGARLVRRALDTFGRLDLLVINDRLRRDRTHVPLTGEDGDAVIAVHLKGHFTVTKYASMVFRQQRSGRIINTSSESGLGNMGQANYSAAKEGIVGLTRTLARDLGRYGVTANAIRPRAKSRLTVSPQMEEAARRAREAGLRTDTSDVIQMMEKLLPEYVAPLVVYLALDEAGYINGRDFLVGGPQISLMSLPGPERTIWNPRGYWTVDELVAIMPQTLGQGLKNPWAPKEQAQPQQAPASS